MVNIKRNSALILLTFRFKNVGVYSLVYPNTTFGIKYVIKRKSTKQGHGKSRFGSQQYTFLMFTFKEALFWFLILRCFITKNYFILSEHYFRKDITI